MGRNRVKSVINREGTTLKRLIVEQDVTGVQGSLGALKEMFQKLEGLHYEYHDSLEVESDIAESEMV